MISFGVKKHHVGNASNCCVATILNIPLSLLTLQTKVAEVNFHVASGFLNTCIDSKFLGTKQGILMWETGQMISNLRFGKAQVVSGDVQPEISDIVSKNQNEEVVLIHIELVNLSYLIPSHG